AKALEGGADVILAGRACDTAPFAVVPVLLGYPKGPAVHMAKILECTSLCCEPGGRDAMLATLTGDAFMLESMNPNRAATPTSVAAHALYEQAAPACVYEPEGHVDLSAARYEALDDRRVTLSGALWHEATTPSVKIEGARFLGHRVVMMAGVADPGVIANSEEILNGVKTVVADLVPPDPDAPWHLSFRRYGIDGVLDWPIPPVADPREIFILGECIANDAETARAVASAARQHILHWGFEGRLCTGGNLAFPITPPELDAGPAYAFSLYHIMQLNSWEALDVLFPITIHDI
ncbi:MAG: acyclic terpene utilization AtuA family protein, partial [Silicimonas sp.]|nr:acyclic terpene utilization AtuA family protein [Silicimonas sp.]